MSRKARFLTVEVAPGLRLRGEFKCVPTRLLRDCLPVDGDTTVKSKGLSLLPLCQVICYQDAKQLVSLIDLTLVEPEIRAGGYSHICVFVLANFEKLCLKDEQRVRAYCWNVGASRAAMQVKDLFLALGNSHALIQYFREWWRMRDPISPRAMKLISCGLSSDASVKRWRREYGFADPKRQEKSMAAMPKPPQGATRRKRKSRRAKPRANPRAALQTKLPIHAGSSSRRPS